MANVKPRVTTNKFKSGLQQPTARSVQSKAKPQTPHAVGQSLSRSPKQKKSTQSKKPTQPPRRSTLMSTALIPIMRSRARTVRAAKSKGKIRTDKAKSKSKSLSTKSATKKPKSTAMSKSNKGKAKSKTKGDDVLKLRAVGGGDVAVRQMKSPKKLSKVKRSSLAAKEVYIDRKVVDLRRKRNRLAAGIEQITTINTSNNPYNSNASKNILANGNYNYDYNNYSNYNNYNNYNYNGNNIRSATAPTGAAAASAAAAATGAAAAGINAADPKSTIDLEVPLTTRLPIIDFISTDEFARMAECRNLRSKY